MKVETLVRVAAEAFAEKQNANNDFEEAIFLVEDQILANDDLLLRAVREAKNLNQTINEAINAHAMRLVTDYREVIE
jgi:hypothetical protein